MKSEPVISSLKSEPVISSLIFSSSSLEPPDRHAPCSSCADQRQTLPEYEFLREHALQKTNAVAWLLLRLRNTHFSALCRTLWRNQRPLPSMIVPPACPRRRCRRRGD